MKKTAIGFLVILLSASSYVHGRRIVNVLATIDNGLLPSAVEATGTFKPDRPTCVHQDTVWHATGTDVRSTSLRPDRPTCVHQDTVWRATGTFIENSLRNEIELTNGPSGQLPQPNIGAPYGTPSSDYPNWAQNYINSTGSGTPMKYLSGTLMVSLNDELTYNKWYHTPATGSAITTDPYILYI